MNQRFKNWSICSSPSPPSTPHSAHVVHTRFHPSFGNSQEMSTSRRISMHLSNCRTYSNPAVHYGNSPVDLRGSTNFDSASTGQQPLPSTVDQSDQNHSYLLSHRKSSSVSWTALPLPELQIEEEQHLKRRSSITGVFSSSTTNSSSTTTGKKKRKKIMQLFRSIAGSSQN